MKSAIFGTVDEHAIEPLILELKEAGFAETHISVLVPNARTPQDTALVPNAKQGAVKGGLIGVIATEFATLASLMIPGVGPFLIAGPIVTALAGAATGSVIGGLTAATGQVAGIIGIPGEVVDRYEDELKKGRGLVMVDYTSAEERRRAERAFENLDAAEVQETVSKK